MTNPQDNSKAVRAGGGRRSPPRRRRRSQTSLNLRDAFQSDQSTSGSASPMSTTMATSSTSSSVHEGDTTAQETVQIDGRDGRLTRREMLEILQAAIDMSNEGLVVPSDSGRPSSDAINDNEEKSSDSSMQ